MAGAWKPVRAVLIAVVPLLAAAAPSTKVAVPLAGEQAGDAVLDAAQCTAITKPIALELPFLLKPGLTMGPSERAKLNPVDDAIRAPVEAFDAGQLLLDETRPKVTLAETRRACGLFQQAARGGLLDAYVPLGQLIWQTADTGANRDLARLAWQRAAGRDQPFARLWLAVLDARTPGADAATRKAAATELARLAAGGFAPANLWLGNAAYEGWAGPPNGVEARGLYEVAARAGIPAAADALGNLLRSGGPGLPPDMAQSERWFAAAFEMGWSRAAMDAGLAAGSPRNLHPDEARARAWLERGAAAGDIGSKARLASFLAFPADPAKRDAKRAYALASEAAAADSPTGNYVVATLLRSGTGVAADGGLALKFERRAIELGSSEAMVDVGNRLVRGEGVTRDTKAGLALIEKAAKQNFTAAICLRGTAELMIEPTPAAAARAEPWLIEGARRDWPQCLFALGDVIVRGWLKDFPDPLVGVGLLARAAEAKDPVAQFTLGEMYWHPTIVERDVDRARKYYEMAAAQNYAPAIERLGRMQVGGVAGFTIDVATARASFERALTLGSADAALALATLAGSGQGEPKDLGKARRLFERAGELGNPEGWARAGVLLYAGGDSLPPDPVAALVLWRRAYAAGYTVIAANIADALIAGRGTVADPAAAIEVLRSAAAKGDASAINNLGTLFQHGAAGVPIDLAAAESWYRKAAPTNAIALINLGYIASNDAAHHDYVAALAYIDAALHGNLASLPPQAMTEIQGRVAELRRVLPADAQTRAYAMSAAMVAGKLPPPFLSPQSP